MDVTVVVTDSVESAHAERVRTRLEPIVRCLARNSRLRPRRVEVLVETGVQRVRWEATLVARKRENQGEGWLEDRSAAGLVAALSSAWDSGGCSGGYLTWRLDTVVPSHPTPPARRPHRDLWRAETTGVLREPMAENRRTFATFGRQAVVRGAGDLAGEAEAIARCHLDEGAAASAVDYFVADVWTDTVTVKLTMRDGTTDSFERPWSGAEPLFLAELDTILSGPFETTADCLHP